MRRSKPIKLIIAGGTAWIFLYPVLFIALWFSTFMGGISSANFQSPFSIFSVFNIIFPIHCLTFIIELTLMGLYLFDIIKNTLVSELLRAIFGVGIFFVPFIAMPVYYLIFIWRDYPPNWALAKETVPSAIVDKSTSLEVESSASGPLSSRKKNIAIIGGIAGAAILVLAAIIVVFTLLVNNMNQTIKKSFFVTPTPIHYENLPLYSATEEVPYYPLVLPSFKPLGTFKGIYTSSYNNHIPILLHNNNVFIAGYFQKPSNSWESRTNVDLVSADISTGKVNWQIIADDAMLLSDSKHIYATMPQDFFKPAGIVAYDINSGAMAWKTPFDIDYAVGISHFALTANGIVVETFNHDNEATYIVDIETGRIKETKKDTPPNPIDEATVYNGLVIEKQHYGAADQIITKSANNGSIIWKYSDQQVVSNIAVGGPITYFLTEKNKLIALDTKTGAILGTLAFAPGFPKDFDFVNTSLIVAANNDMVAVYFEDSKQLSVFRFTKPN